MKTINARTVLALFTGMAVAGCGNVLDVENPNNLDESGVLLPQASASLVNGSQALVYDAYTDIIEPLLVGSDDIEWGQGSRDAWGQLDQGLIGDPVNEFTDARFPSVGEARWQAEQTVGLINGHLEDDPGNADLIELRGRANLYAGMAYLLIGEVMHDFAFSDRREDGEPVGPENMLTQVFDPAIQYFTDAIADAEAQGDAETALRALALRARAHHARALRAKIQPSIDADPLISSAASADAAAVLGAINAEDWRYDLEYSAATVTNAMSSNINSRGDNEISSELIDFDRDAGSFTVLLNDPIDDVPDPALNANMTRFRVQGDPYRPHTIVSARMMHLILAEAALADGGSVEGGTFADHMNNLRALDDLTPFSGQISEQDMLVHARRVNLVLQGQRLHDMFRFGIVDPAWLPGNTTLARPGELLPISCIERRANSFLDISSC